MSVNVSTKKVYGFDKELLLVGEGYIARPVTVNKDTISGLIADEDGRYVIPQGTYLYGADGVSLLENPQQFAIAVVPSVTHASATINSSIEIEAKQEGNLVYTISLVAPSVSTPAPSISVTGTGATPKTIVITLATDSTGNVLSTYGDIVDLINNDMVANTFIIASLSTGVDPDTVAVATGADVSTSGGGDETVDSDIDGILYHSVDVTNGEATGALIIHAYIDVDNMPSVPGAAVKAKLPHIVFARKD